MQIGFSLLLIVAAGLFVRTIQNLHNVDAGFATDHLLAFNLCSGDGGLRARRDYRRSNSASSMPIATLPGVRAAGATNDADLRGDDREGDVLVERLHAPARTRSSTSSFPG